MNRQILRADLDIPNDISLSEIPVKGRIGIRPFAGLKLVRGDMNLTRCSGCRGCLFRGAADVGRTGGLVDFLDGFNLYGIH